MNDDFEWDSNKAASNLRRHGVSFEQAVLAFEDAFAMVEQDESEDYGEDRFILIGRALEGLFTIVYTEPRAVSGSSRPERPERTS